MAPHTTKTLFLSFVNWWIEKHLWWWYVRWVAQQKFKAAARSIQTFVIRITLKIEKTSYLRALFQQKHVDWAHTHKKPTLAIFFAMMHEAKYDRKGQSHWLNHESNFFRSNLKEAPTFKVLFIKYITLR